MRKLLYISIVVSCLIGCVPIKKVKTESRALQGAYKRNKSSEKLVLNSEGTYILKKAEISFTPIIEQCEISSKGKWSVLSSDVLELTSEDNYLKQKGFEYELKKESKLSQDSVYIKVILPNDYAPSIKLNFCFNNNISKSIETEKTFIAIPKSKYLWTKSSNSINKNQIHFSVNANISGATLYNSRILFEIFEEDIDTEKSNFFTITLPYFDRCFFEFEPLNKELIYFKNGNQLFWQGDVWERIE
jgi:hypothetical protein